MLKHIEKLTNKIQNYAWGSHTAIPELMNKESVSDVPQAELWLGAHPKASSEIIINGKHKTIIKIIEESPNDILGKKTAAKFNNRLPYLFKILAAAKPLSIQAHPNKAMAVKGYDQENKNRIPIDAHNRNYKDNNHKPELICALTPFWALNGFRKIKDIIRLLEQINYKGLNGYNVLKKEQNFQAFKHFFNELMIMQPVLQKNIIEQAVKNAENLSNDNIIFEWIVKLNNEYPLDVGVLSPILLNLIYLKPEQAMFLQAGTLHAYLGGTCIELMANSDNVLRGGLTPKHVDVPELLKNLDFNTQDVKIILPEESNIKYEKIYKTDADEFILSVIILKNGDRYASPIKRSAEIIICTNGKGEISEEQLEKKILIQKGESVIIPAVVKKYYINGNATLYKAGVPI